MGIGFNRCPYQFTVIQRLNWPVVFGAMDHRSELKMDDMKGVKNMPQDDGKINHINIGSRVVNERDYYKLPS